MSLDDSPSSPVPSAAPVAEPERIQAIDVLRGIALLGILPVNMISFAHVFAAYMNPSLAGGFEGLDYAVWSVVHFLFEGKMITLFSLLFGAGLFLQVSRAEARRGRVGSARWLYLRRVGWLLLFGLIHAYLFWYGDILTMYAIIGFLIYWLRRLRPRWLISLSVLFLCLGATLFGLYIMSLRPDSKEYQKMHREMVPSRAAIEREERQVRQDSFLELAEHRAPKTLQFQLQMLFFAVFRLNALMLLGIAFVKLDILTARRSPHYYGRMAVICLALGLPLTALAGWMMSQPYDLVRAFTSFACVDYFGTFFQALGYLALVMLMVQRGWLPALQARFAAVGRMALTNYLTHTLICTFIFMGWGLGQFGYWSRTQQFLLVLAIWGFQLLISPIWLRHFQFGPMEWLWRTLTYLRRQPFRRVSTGEPA
jgi:uncharacterized protein